MPILQCRGFHKRYYSDAYPANRHIIYIESIPFSLIKLGFKFCTKCEFFTCLEPSKFCKCCHNTLVRSTSLYEAKKRRLIEKKNMVDKVSMRYQELTSYSNLVDITTPRNRALKYHLRRKKTNRQILDTFIKNSKS